MRQLTLADLKVALADLLEKRLADVERSRAGQYYLPDLKETQSLLDALPAALTSVPLADRLAQTDALHDGYGGAIYYLTEGYLRLPKLSPETRQAAERIRAALVPALEELSAAYVMEADRAAERRPKLAQLEVDGKRFPVAEHGSLHELAVAFVAAGEALGNLLSERADLTARTRKDAGGLRSKTIGLLGRLREDLVKEVTRDNTLPRDLETRVFGFIDLLAAQSAVRNAKKGEPGKDEGKGQGESDNPSAMGAAAAGGQDKPTS